MNELASQVSSVAHVIQLAVAPVFLLAGVGALLGVLTSRLARVVDRFYALEHALAEQPSPENRQRAQTTIVSLARRARLIHWAITLCTACDLLVCVVIVVLFVGAEMHVELPGTIAGLFVAAMLALIAGLVCFLREIALFDQHHRKHRPFGVHFQRQTLTSKASAWPVRGNCWAVQAAGGRIRQAGPG